jgi:hypothetical protein
MATSEIATIASGRRRRRRDFAIDGAADKRGDGFAASVSLGLGEGEHIGGDPHPELRTKQTAHRQTSAQTLVSEPMVCLESCRFIVSAAPVD